MAAEDNLSNQFTVKSSKKPIRAHEFTWRKLGSDRFISCCNHRAVNTGRSSDKRWALNGKWDSEISTHRSAASAKEAARKLHEEGDHAW